MIDPIRHLLGRLDCEESPTVSAGELRKWPANAAEFMLRSGILRALPDAAAIVFDECDERCVITPDIVKHPRTGKVVGVFHCKREGCGRIELEASELQQWELHFESVAVTVANELELDGEVSSIILGRVCLLGTVATGGGPLDVFLARGLAWDDAAAVIERADRLATSTGPAVIVLRAMPEAKIWQRGQPPTIALFEHIAWSDSDSRIDAAALRSLVGSLRPPIRDASWLTVTQGAELLQADLPHLDLKKARARVSDAANRKKFITNEKTGRERLIEINSFSSWRLIQRDKGLDAEEGSD